MSEKNLPLSGEEIILDKDKTFSYLAHRNYYVPEQLLDEISKTIRHLVESGKDTLLVRYGNGAERLFIDCFLALRSEYPNLRLIKVTYDEDNYNKELSKLAGLVVSVKNSKQMELCGLDPEIETIEEFMMSASSAVICYMSYTDYSRSLLKKHAQSRNDFEVINLFKPTLKSAAEKDIYRLLDSSDLTPEEIAARLSDWKPFIPFQVYNRTREFKRTIEAFSLQYADSPEKLKEINSKLLATLFYYAYCMGIQDTEKG